ncbi:unnamed protein product [Urochloa decumbens]|uniref:Transcription factor CBF/NF-Y/archaeal histone domain-containing protein n=1 Tax=Urochloa decumbens TaxID=240449 RepID=A0ABC9DFF1_9POAL
MEKHLPKNQQDGGTEASKEPKIPTVTVARIMRQASPKNSKITTDAKEAVTECVVEFNAVIIHAAVEECRRDRRTTVTGDDLILAMKNLGFDDYVEPLTLYLQRYREVEGNNPRARHSTIASLEAAATPVPVAPTVEPDLTLQLGPPSSVHDITELGVNDDVYAVWRGTTAAPAAGTSQAAAPPASDDEK